MRIGLISGEYAPMPGGLADFTRILADRIQRRGHDVCLLSCQGCSSDGLPLSAVASWGALSLPAIRRWADQRALDIVNLQFQTAAYDMSPLIHFLPSLLDQPIVTTFHDLRAPYLFPKAGFLRDWIVLELARSSDGVIVTNSEDAAQLADLPRPALIPIGSNIPSAQLDAEARAEWRHRLGAGGATLLLGHFGFIKAAKGIDSLLDALADLRGRGRELRLVFIGARSNPSDGGADQDYLAALEQQIDQRGLTGHIHFTDYLRDDEVAACLSALDLATLPYLDGASWRRGSLLAAIQNGCAILTTHPGAPVGAFKHGENMFLAEAGSADAIASAIAGLMDDADLVKKLRFGARELSRQFDWDAIAEATLAFYRQTLRAARYGSPAIDRVDA